MEYMIVVCFFFLSLKYYRYFSEKYFNTDKYAFSNADLRVEGHTFYLLTFTKNIKEESYDFEKRKQSILHRSIFNIVNNLYK